MKRFYFFMLAMFAVIAASATTVYFENTANWSTVNAYAWSPNNAAWPGVKVTETVTVTVQGSNETKTLYKYELPGAQENIIFNNGSGAQTKDLKAVDGTVYSGANTGNTYSIGSVSGDKFIPAGQVEITYGKIYVPVSQYDHSVAHIYSWAPEVFGGWPGRQMTKVTENGYDFWMIEVDNAEIPATVTGWQLNEGSNVGQTGDLPSVTFQKDYVYELTGKVTPLADYQPAPDVITYAIHGQIFGNTSWESYDMTEENGVWSYTGNAVPGDFGIKKMVNGSQTDWYAADGDNKMTADKEVYDAKVNGTNWNSSLMGEYTFTFDPEALTLTVTGNGGEEPTITYALKGTIFGDSDWTSYNMTEENGVWSYTGNAVRGDFGIQKLANGTQVDWLFASGSNEIKENKVYPVTNNGGANWTNLLTGEVTFAFDPEAMTLTVSGGTYEEVEKVWYVSYNIGDGWQFNKLMDEYVYDGAQNTVYAFFTPVADVNYFTFTDAEMVSWNVPGGTRYGCGGDADLMMQPDVVYPLVAGSDKCFTLPAGQYNVKVNTEDLTVTVDKDQPSGIETIEAANAAAEYFNLQGVRIANPAKGQIVIERRGATVTKRIF